MELIDHFDDYIDDGMELLCLLVMLSVFVAMIILKFFMCIRARNRVLREKLERANKSLAAKKRTATKHSLLFESSKPGHAWLMGAIPQGQFSVWSRMPDRENAHLIGHGYRDGDWLVAPSHVINAVPGSVLLVAVTDKDKGVHEFVGGADLIPSKWTEIAADLSAVKLPVDEYSKIRLKSISLSHYSGTTPVQITTNHVNSNSSIGVLRPHTFGVLEYDGNTRTGFSGALYVREKRAVAMHIGGGQLNLAYSLSYIHNLLVVKESSELEALRRLLASGHADQIKWASTGVDGELQAEYQGRYYRISQDEYDDFMDEQDRLDRERVDAQVFGGEDVEFKPTRRIRMRKGEFPDAGELYSRLEYEEECDKGEGNSRGGASGPPLIEDVVTTLHMLSSKFGTMHLTLAKALQDFSGRNVQIEQLCDHLQSTTSMLSEQKKALSLLTSQNDSLLARCSQLETRFDSKMSQGSTSTAVPEQNVSAESSENLTTQEALVLGCSPEAQLQAPPLAGTELCAPIPLQWKPLDGPSTSVSSSSPVKRKKNVRTFSSLRNKLRECYRVMEEAGLEPQILNAS